MKKNWSLLVLVLIVLVVPLVFAIISFATTSTPEELSGTTAAAETTAPTEPEYFYNAAREGILSSYYHIDREKAFILGIAPGTTAETLRNVCLPSNVSLSMDKPATGAVLSVPGEEGAAVSPLTVIVTGDLNGDGSVTITDMLMLKSAVLGEQLSPEATVAGDINYDGGVTITDFLRVKSVLLGISGIPAGRPVGAEPADPIVLMTPGTTAGWPAGAASYVSGDESLALIDAAGTITTLAEEGSAFMYALDANGQMISRRVVTVLNEKLTVSMEPSELSLLTGSTGNLSVSFNHPFTSPVTWSSSDPETVAVDENGALTALKAGNAVVTAALDNGSTAEATVTVIPPITSLQIERKLYKVKPENTKAIALLAEPADVGEVFLWESSDPNIATISEAGVVTGVSYGTVTVTVTGKYSGLTASCEVKVCDVIQVAMTFDDGPSLYTEQLLDFLKEKDIKVTFFLVANRLTSFKEETIREVNEGHEIGYHSYAHDIQTGLSSEKITSDFIKSNELLKEMTGAEFTLWRTPGGGYSERVLRCVELPHILWSLDTLDWKSLNANSVYLEITRGAEDGDIILVHDLHRTTVEGSIKAMTEMLEGDYEFVTVTELLSRDGTPPENCKTYTNG